MTSPTKPGVAVATTPAEATQMQKRVDGHVARLKAQRAQIQAIRGTQWGKDCSERVQAAVAAYCVQNALDAVRHVEVLGGRIYLTAEFYREKAAPLILAGHVAPLPYTLIHNDKRLLALLGSSTPAEVEYAKAESWKRTQLRIEHGCPDEATGACITQLRITASGEIITGVNWCGGGTNKKMGKGGTLYDADPVGDKDPVKTAITRSERRAWRELVVAIPEYGKQVQQIEARATAVIDDALDVQIEGPAQLGAGEESQDTGRPNGETEDDVGTTQPSGASDAPKGDLPHSPALPQAQRTKAWSRYMKLVATGGERTDAETDELANIQEAYPDFKPE